MWSGSGGSTGGGRSGGGGLRHVDVWVPEEEVGRWREEGGGEGERTASRDRRGPTLLLASSGDESDRVVDVGDAHAAGGGRVGPSSARRSPGGRFGWVVKAAPKGKGLQKRKKLLAALLELWDAMPSSDKEELPAAMKRAVYKAMAGVMTPK